MPDVPPAEAHGPPWWHSICELVLGVGRSRRGRFRIVRNHLRSSHRFGPRDSLAQRHLHDQRIPRVATDCHKVYSCDHRRCPLRDLHVTDGVAIPETNILRLSPHG